MTSPNLVAPPPPKSPWQRFYGAVHRWRQSWYEERARHLGKPVISIGNLCWGGAGKTPLTASLAAWLRDWLAARGDWLAARDHPHGDEQSVARVAILSRGYGRQDNETRIVSIGEGPLLPSALAGDEPRLLAEALPGVAVVVSPSRAEAGRAALEHLQPPPEIFLLDDGFSHLQLARDLDLLAFPASDPFAGGKLPPGGRLREPLANARRAGAVLLTGCDPNDPAAAARGHELALALRPHGFEGPGFTSYLESAPARWVHSSGGREEPPNRGTRVLLVSAIARPENFRSSALRQGLRVVDHLEFHDHHAYPDSSLERIRNAFGASDAEAVLVTTKDRVKLLGRLDDLPLAELPVRARPEAAFWDWFEAWLQEKLS